MQIMDESQGSNSFTGRGSSALLRLDTELFDCDDIEDQLNTKAEVIQTNPRDREEEEIDPDTVDDGQSYSLSTKSEAAKNEEELEEKN